MTATLTKWYEEHGRHQIYAGGKTVALHSTEHHLVLNDEIVTEVEQQDLDVLGIAKNARQEKILARTRRNENNLRMAQLYREVVLKEPTRPRLVQIHGASAPGTECNLELVGRNED
jgi:7,8-dihydro-6-hydroxymethylpterin dimethyltransferase